VHKIVLALGDRTAEQYFAERQVKYKIAGITSHRGGVYQQLAHHQPRVLVIRDNLPGKEDFLQLIFRIRGEFPDLLIIVLAHGRQAGDPVLAALVNYGVHNIVYGEGINLNSVINLLDKPMSYADVQHLQPIATLDEDTDRVSLHHGSEQGSHGPPEQCIRELPAGLTDPVAVLEERIEDRQPVVDDKDVAVRTQKPKREKVFTRNIRQAAVACWSVSRGVGSSTMALNLAVVFADNGYRTIFLELDPDLPSTGIWLSLYGLDKGIETVLRDPASFGETLINRHVKSYDDTGLTGRILKKLPPSLDLLVFSQAYLVNENTKSPGGYEDLRNLLTALVFHHQYDMVVMDLAPGLDHPLTTAGLKTCNHILCSVTGDIALLAHTRLAMEKMSAWVPGAEKKLQLVHNRSTGNCAPDFQELIGREADFSLPETLELPSSLAQTGLPAALDSRFRSYREALEYLAGGINPVTLTSQIQQKGLLKKILGR
jgi:Mrp family chromosome partitioning ATPase